MSAGFQSVSIVGNMGKDPEVRSTPNGTKVMSFSVGVECGFGDSAWTEWFNCVLFSDKAERAEKMKVKKGAKVAITGKLKTRSWNDQNSGEKKYRTELIADTLDYFSEKSGGGSGRSEGRQQSQPQTRQQTPAPSRQAANDDPFASEPDF